MRYTMLLAACVLVFSLFVAESAEYAKRSVADLIGELKKGEKEQLKAIEELDALGEKAADAAPALVGLLVNKNEDVRLHATMALGKIGERAVAPLVKALESATDG